jgi:MFS family permease
MDHQEHGAALQPSAAVSRTGFPAPTEPVGPRFVIPFALAYFGYWVAFLTVPIVGMSVHLSHVLPPDQRNSALSLILGVGGIVNLFVNPLVGKLSDRTTSPLGMRKPWMIAGAVVAVVGMVIIGTSATVPMILLGWCIATAGVNAAAAAIVALMPDRVPHHQRGKVSGILGWGTPVGAVGGALLAQNFTAQPLLMFLVPALVLALGVVILVVSYSDRRLTPAEAAQLPKFGVREFFGSYWVSPRTFPDFGWTWLSRFLVFMGVATLVTFQAFYLINQLGYGVEEVAGLIAVSTLVHYVFVFVSSPIAGWLSDRLDRRKVFIAVTALLYAVGLVFIASASTFTVFLIGMAITGIGEGAYAAVDLALVTDVLPNPDEAAKEMGVFTVANTLPPAVAPAIAPLFLAIPLGAIGEGGNFVALFAASALLAILGAAAIRPVRSVR